MSGQFDTDLSAQMEFLLEKLKEIPELKTVDLYYNQDENKLNILKYPAALCGIQNISYDKGDRIKGYERVITAIILLLNLSVTPCKEKELLTMDLIDKVFVKLSPIHQIEFKSTNILERTSTLTAVAIEIEITGDQLL